MKKLIVSLVLLCTITGLSAQSNVIKTNPLGLAFGNFNASFERVISPSSSVLVQGNYWYSVFGSDVSLGGLGAGYRFYITHAKKEVPAGFYVNPLVSYAFGKKKNDNSTSDKASLFSVGAALGYQWVWDSGFVLDLNIGPGYSILTIGDEVTKGISPVASFAIGYAF